MCSYLCVPSPACRELVGQKIGRETVDVWGDRVQAQTGLTGDTYRQKHDTVKLKLYNLAKECRLPASCEVFSVFSPCIPQRGLARIERGRQRQSMVPDFKFEMPVEVGGNRAGRASALGELKTITFCPSYFPEGARKRGVEIRADALPAEYARKARNADRDYCDTQPGQQGPVEAKLGQYSLLKLAIGPLAECSQDLHNLLNTMAESKVEHQARQQGREVKEEQYSSSITYLRRQVSVCGVRAIADCLFSRLLQVGQQGPGAAAAARRRSFAMFREEKARKERSAHWLLHTRGHQVLQRGQFLQT